VILGEKDSNLGTRLKDHVILKKQAPIINGKRRWSVFKDISEIHVRKV